MKGSLHGSLAIIACTACLDCWHHTLLRSVHVGELLLFSRGCLACMLLQSFRGQKTGFDQTMITLPSWCRKRAC